MLNVRTPKHTRSSLTEVWNNTVCGLQDLTDKDDLIGQRTVKIKEFIRKEKEKKFDLLDKDGKLVKGNDGKTTTVVVRLKAVRTQKAGSLLTVPGVLSIDPQTFHMSSPSSSLPDVYTPHDTQH